MDLLFSVNGRKSKGSGVNPSWNLVQWRRAAWPGTNRLTSFSLILFMCQIGIMHVFIYNKHNVWCKHPINTSSYNLLLFFLKSSFLLWQMIMIVSMGGLLWKFEIALLKYLANNWCQVKKKLVKSHTLGMEEKRFE